MKIHTEVATREQSGPYEALFEALPHGLIQQSVLWSDVVSPISPDEPYFLVTKEVATDSVIGGLPLYLFKGPLGNILTSVPHAGPLGGCLTASGATAYASLLKRAIALANELNCVALSIITNPFAQDEAAYTAAVAPTYTLRNFCQVIDLEKVHFDERGEVSVGSSSLNNNLRRNIRIAKEHGLKVRWAKPSEFVTWYAIHQKRHQELSVSPLPQALLSGMVELATKTGKGGLAVIESHSKIIGGGIFVWHRDIADAYILSSTSDTFQDRPNYLLTEFAIRELKQKNIRILNWQSCKRDSGVYAFKKGWGSEEREYSFLTWTFPGFEKILESEPQQISQLYPWHYVAPFTAIQKKDSSGTYQKDH